MRSGAICVHFHGRSLLAVHQTIFKSSYRMKGLEERRPKRLK